jgi:pantoate kinase
MSAAGALATGLAVASASGGSRSEAVATAHLAELFGGGGLGGVAAILGGGLEIRATSGIPPWGKILHHEFTGTVFVTVAGDAMPSPKLLGDPRFLDRVERAAGPGLHRLSRHPTATSFLVEAERFTDALHLGPAAVLRRVKELRLPGVRVAQAMFGRSLFAVPGSRKAREALIDRLRRTALRAVEVPVATRGAHLIPRRARH